MKSFVVVTSIQKKYKYLLGPSLVAVELSKAIESKGVRSDFYDTYSDNKVGSVFNYIKVFFILLLKNNSVVLVNSQGYVTSLIFCLFRWLRPSHEVIYTIHGIPLKENTYRNKNGIPKGVFVQDFALRVLLRLAKKVVFVSNMQKEYVLINYKCNADVVVIYNGAKISNNDFSNKEINQRRAVMAGGVTGLKSTIEAIKAFSCYNSIVNEKWKLDIYGNVSDQSLMPLVTELCNKSGGLISYHGQLDQVALHHEISSSDLYVAMSKWDTFNLAALEAMSLGVPCICSKQSGVSELVAHNENGFVVDAESTALIDECIKILSTIDSLGDGYSKIKKETFKTASNYNWARVADRYIDFSEK